MDLDHLVDLVRESIVSHKSVYVYAGMELSGHSYLVDLG